jgi:hypothetical protein
MNQEQPSPSERIAAYNARFAMFCADAHSSEVNERFSQLLLAFAAAALGFFAEKIHSRGAHGDTSLLGIAATLLCLSLLVGAAQLILAHMAALIRVGLANPDILSKELQKLEPAAQVRILREVVAETLASRFWPDTILLKRALTAPDFLEAIADVLRKLRRMIQFQALLYRLQLLLAAVAAIPVLLAIFR